MQTQIVFFLYSAKEGSEHKNYNFVYVKDFLRVYLSLIWKNLSKYISLQYTVLLLCNVHIFKLYKLDRVGLFYVGPYQKRE